ncbi:hypothetical protein E2C01_016284 [Portunus trituberculatus]|uniref:Uncharacterized protein n=1 Tax=Portunus trituberculatus TaxID=210409 RepID=A0A5B7DQI3_PORTR|nr:hypothetical protein [Portunus trituberculatus]
MPCNEVEINDTMTMKGDYNDNYYDEGQEVKGAEGGEDSPSTPPGTRPAPCQVASDAATAARFHAHPSRLSHPPRSLIPRRSPHRRPPCSPPRDSSPPQSSSLGTPEAFLSGTQEEEEERQYHHHHGERHKGTEQLTETLAVTHERRSSRNNDYHSENQPAEHVVDSMLYTLHRHPHHYHHYHYHHHHWESTSVGGAIPLTDRRHLALTSPIAAQR